MSYTPAQISASYGGDVFTFDYPHAKLAQTFSFGSGAWSPYTASDVAVRDVITPAVGSDGQTSIAGTWSTSITLFHLTTYSGARIEWDGSGVTVEYSLDGGATWVTISQATTVALDPAHDPDLDVRVAFAGGVLSDTSVLNSLTVYILATGGTESASGSRTLTFGNDPIEADGLHTTGGTISAAPVQPALPDGTTPVGAEPVEVASIELRAAIGLLGTTIFSGSGISFGTNGSGVPQASGCTVYINGIVSTSSPSLTATSQPYHFVIVPTTPVNEEFTLGTGLTVSNLALYTAAISSSQAFELYTSDANGTPTITIDDDSVITVTESSPAVDVYAYAWSIVSGSL